MKFIIKLLLSAVAVFALASILPGIEIQSYQSALVLAIVLGVLNAILKPVLVFLTLPITVVTLGLFLLVINAAIVLLGGCFVDGFTVDGWLWAMVFSVLLSILQSVLHSVLKRDEE